ncbi:MAG TPA: glycoside hydrolase family 88 protein [Cyclobacteriaceae bacterium]|nr:glycoside hydrolase family 88 protein [Cyclobacteriaceae bacterium]
MRKVCSWQILNPVEMNDGNGMAWARSALYAGVMSTYYTTGDVNYLLACKDWASQKEWKLDQRYDHADDHSCGQTYLEIFFLEHKEYMINSAVSTFDRLILENRNGDELYWWADALFMSPTVLARLYQATGEIKYYSALNKWWWESQDLLYDSAENLFFQSHWYFTRKTPNGFKTFWARANGWVIAGIVRIIEYLPEEDPYYHKYLDIYKAMAGKIAALQSGDGLWRSSLLDSLESPYPEASSTGFFTYAIAWGINEGLLPEAQFGPVVERAWKGLVNSIHPDGKLGWVQGGDSAPGEVSYDDYQEYGAGAFLLAGSELFKLKSNF